MQNGLTEEKIDSIIQKGNCDRENILSILLDLQFASKDGYIDRKTAQIVAEKLGMSETRVFEIISYYAMLKAKPQAKYVLKICNSAPCHFSKSQEIVDILKIKLGVQIGETTPDGVFAFHYIPCVGACDIGPVIKVKDTVFGNLNEDKITTLLQDLRLGQLEV